MQEILNLLYKVFGKKIDQKIGGKTIQTRIRDYISSSHSTLVTETTGQGFLTIVRKESKNHITSPANPHYENYNDANSVDDFQDEQSPANLNSPEGTGGIYDVHWKPDNVQDNETDPVQRAKNFYPIGNVFDTSDLNGLPKEYIQKIHEYQDVKYAYLPNKFIDGVPKNASLRNGQRTQAPEPIQEPSFDELYQTLQDKSKKAATNDPELNQQYKWFDNLKDIEKQIKQEEETLALHKVLDTTLDGYREKILDAVKGRWDNMAFMKITSNSILKNQSEQKNKAPVMDREFCEKVLAQENFVKV